jgi:hypothetical protein
VDLSAFATTISSGGALKRKGQPSESASSAPTASGGGKLAGSDGGVALFTPSAAAARNPAPHSKPKAARKPTRMRFA